ncbi:hypothetical protein A3Q56_07707 [Intoshia linei]|uniref:Peptidase A2 domain-containing protein n=1 Tax=Intoshia linei TaxID=1819745 RepID=A0A177AT72_9BILA|nr:hypothetical protein A3Q56_07707 [Intoshia linei]
MDVNEWMSQFENFMVLNYEGINDKRKMALLKICIGAEALRRLNGKESYTEMITEIKTWDITNVLSNRQDFLNTSQHPNESFCSYIAKIKRLYRATGYKDESIILDVFIRGIQNNNIKARLLTEEALIWNKAIKLCANYESINALSVNKIENNVNKSSKRCFRCGSINHLANDDNCPGRTIKCAKIGHFTKMCNPKFSRRSVANKTIKVNIDNRDIKIIVDTGSEVSLLPIKFVGDQMIFKTVIQLANEDHEKDTAVIEEELSNTDLKLWTVVNP